MHNPLPHDKPVGLSDVNPRISEKFAETKSGKIDAVKSDAQPAITGVSAHAEEKTKSTQDVSVKTVGFDEDLAKTLVNDGIFAWGSGCSTR